MVKNNGERVIVTKDFSQNSGGNMFLIQAKKGAVSYLHTIPFNSRSDARAYLATCNRATRRGYRVVEVG